MAAPYFNLNLNLPSHEFLKSSNMNLFLNASLKHIADLFLGHLEASLLKMTPHDVETDLSTSMGKNKTTIKIHS